MTALGEKGPIAVLGAGPAGALLAIYLAKQGHRVELYESRPDLRTTDIAAGRSINLALATRGIAALADVGAMDRVDAITIPMAGRMIHDLEGDQSLQPYGSASHEVIHSVSRTDLNAILLDEAEATGLVTIHFEHWCRAVDLDQRTLSFTVGDTRSADEIRPEDLTVVPFGVVFGCDGANSVVRAALEDRGVATVDRQPLGHGYKELTLPPGERRSDGSVRFRLDPNALHIWPRGGFMLIALANPAGDFTVTLFMPHDDEAAREVGLDVSLDSLSEPADIEEFFGRWFGDFAAMMPDLVGEYHNHPNGSLSTIRTTGWSYGDVAVCVGDAAHAIVPFHGQGMNLAMESTMYLAAQLLAHPDDLAAAFAAFEAERKADADAIADMALDNYIEMRSDVADEHYLLRRQLALELERRHPDRFKARYGMVMFTALPYAQVQERARRQLVILSELIEGVTSVDQVDVDRADALVAELEPLPVDLLRPPVATLSLADEGRWAGDETV